MIKRSRNSLVSNPITYWSVMHWASTPRGMQCPQPKNTAGAVRPLERGVKDGALSEDQAIERLSRSPQWVWTAMDPESKLLLVMDVGPRTLAMAQCVVHQVVQ